MLKPEDVVELNKLCNGPGTLTRKDLLYSAFSAIDYYETPELQICSIVRGIIKNHPFVDGNKRTALMVLYTLSETKQLHLISDEKLFDAIVDIAKNNYSVESIAKKVFK
jgi:death-on-curing protein